VIQKTIYQTHTDAYAYLCRQWDDETGQPTRLVGFDPSQPTSCNGGKIRAISKIREDNPYNTVVMIGGAGVKPSHAFNFRDVLLPVG